MRCWFHSVPSVRFWLTHRSNGILTSLCSITSERSISENWLLLKILGAARRPSPLRELRVCSYCAQLLVVTPLSQPPFRSRSKYCDRDGWSLYRSSLSPDRCCWCFAYHRRTGCPAAIASFKLQRLHRREIPAHHAVDVLFSTPSRPAGRVSA